MAEHFSPDHENKLRNKRQIRHRQLNNGEKRVPTEIVRANQKAKGRLCVEKRGLNLQNYSDDERKVVKHESVQFHGAVSRLRKQLTDVGGRPRSHRQVPTFPQLQEQG